MQTQAQKVRVQDLNSFVSEVCELVGDKLPVHIFMYRKGEITIAGSRGGATYEQMIPCGVEPQHITASAAFEAADLARSIDRVVYRSNSEFCEVTLCADTGNLKFGYKDVFGRKVWLDTTPIRGSAYVYSAGNDGPTCRQVKKRQKSGGWYARYLASLGW